MYENNNNLKGYKTIIEINISGNVSVRITQVTPSFIPLTQLNAMEISPVEYIDYE